MRASRTVLVAAWLALLGVAPSAAGVVLRVAYHDDVATTLMLAATERLPLGPVALPEPGETETTDANDWTLLLQGGAGVAFAADDEEEDGEEEDVTPTVAADIGLLRRLGTSFPDRVGLLFVSSFSPWGAGPALRAEARRAFALEVGGLWFEQETGIHVYAAAEVSMPFLRDIF